jgi:hypothetical protein
MTEKEAEQRENPEDLQGFLFLFKRILISHMHVRKLPSPEKKAPQN